MSSFLLKVVAMITMVTDHIGYAIFNGNISFCNYIGRIAFPIFAFQISEGYIHTKNLKKYFFRLLLFAVISQIPFVLFHSLISTEFEINIFFTLLLGLSAIFLYDKIPNKFLGILVGISIAIIAQYSKCDYGFFGVAIILLFYIFKNSKIKMTISFVIACIIKYIIPILQYGFHIEYLYLFLGTISSILFILLYNGKKGKSMKYFLYLFYPIHLLIIYLFSVWGLL
jgi:hypothetical protein